MAEWKHCCSILYSSFFNRCYIPAGSHIYMKNAYYDTMCQSWMVAQPGHMLWLSHVTIVSAQSKVHIVGAFISLSDIGLKIVDQTYPEWARCFMVRFKEIQWLSYMLFRMLCLEYFEGFVPFLLLSGECHCFHPSLCMIRAGLWSSTCIF